jgi:predicted transcriptional regulator
MVLHQTRKLLHSKENNQQTEKATYKLGKNVQTKDTKIYTMLLELKKPSPIKKLAKHLNRNFSKKGIKISPRTMKKYLIPLIIIGLQIKTTIRY